MALLDVFNDAKTAFPTWNSKNVIHFFGPQGVWKEERPPRVVWVPTADRFEAPDPHQPDFTKPGSKIIGIEPRAIFTRVAGVDVHLWAESYSDAEAMLESYVATLWSGVKVGLWGAMDIDAGRWGSTDGREVSQLGTLYILPISLRVPVRMPAGGVATILNEDVTTVIGS